MAVPTPPNGPAANNNYNTRMPDLQKPGMYPYITFYQSRSGNWTRQDDTPGYISHAHGHVTGSFHETDAGGSHKKLDAGFSHQYATQGSSTTTDGNHDNKLGGSHVNRVGADHFAEHAGDLMHAIGGDVIHAAAGIHFQHATGGTQVTSTGDHVSDHNDGNHHINIAGDHVQYIEGVKYLSVSQDMGVHLPNGNFDQNVSNNYNMQSNTKLTLKVGSSIITILPQSIVIHDGNGNEVGMNSSQMWVGPASSSTIVYLGGNGSSGTYDFVQTASMVPSINVKARIG